MEENNELSMLPVIVPLCKLDSRHLHFDDTAFSEEDTNENNRLDAK